MRRALPSRRGGAWVESALVIAACLGGVAALGSLAPYVSPAAAGMAAAVLQVAGELPLGLAGAVAATMLSVAVIDRIARSAGLRGIG